VTSVLLALLSLCYCFDGYFSKKYCSKEKEKEKWAFGILIRGLIVWLLNNLSRERLEQN